MQKGLFHQGMHQTALIFVIYYGGFLQAIQVELGVKQVMGDSLKGSFQDHERFLVKTYLACNRYLHRCFLKSIDLSMLECGEDESPAKYLNRIHHAFRSFQKSWETSDNEPSRMVALFLKTASSFYRCKLGIGRRDFWLLEDESCKWIGFSNLQLSCSRPLR